MIRIALLLTILLAPALAEAQGRCGPRADVLRMVQKKYGEKLVGRGVVRGRSVVEFWSNPETGTWSFTSTPMRGAGAITCLMAAGHGWKAGVPAAPAKRDGQGI